MFLEGHFQNAYVTRNLDEAIEMLRSKYDLDDLILLSPNLIVRTPHGEGPAILRAALIWIGPFQIEIIEPVSGLVEHYQQYLPDDDTSIQFHHLGMRVDDFEATRAELVRQNRPIVFEGGLEGLKFLYVDARDTLGHYLEYAWCTSEMWNALGGR